MAQLNPLTRLTAGLVGEREPAQPLLTLRDGDARVELSGATVANWVAKTANLLTDTAGGPARVGLLLPLHWQTVTLLLGAVAGGAVVVVAETAGALAGCEVAFTLPGSAAEVMDAGVDEVFAVSAAPLGGRLRDLPAELTAAGLMDAGRELPVHGDHFGGPPPRGWRVELQGGSVGPVPDSSLGGQDRVLTLAPPCSYAGLVLGILTPLHAGAAVVLLSGAPTAEAVTAAVREEAVTAVVGVDVGVSGVRRLDSSS